MILCPRCESISCSLSSSAVKLASHSLADMKDLGWFVGTSGMSSSMSEGDVRGCLVVGAGTTLCGCPVVGNGTTLCGCLVVGDGTSLCGCLVPGDGTHFILVEVINITVLSVRHTYLRTTVR